MTAFGLKTKSLPVINTLINGKQTVLPAPHSPQFFDVALKNGDRLTRFMAWQVALAMRLPAGTSPGGGMAKTLTQFRQPLAHPDAVCGAQMTERIGQFFCKIVWA